MGVASSWATEVRMGGEAGEGDRLVFHGEGESFCPFVLLGLWAPATSSCNSIISLWILSDSLWLVPVMLFRWLTPPSLSGWVHGAQVRAVYPADGALDHFSFLKTRWRGDRTPRREQDKSAAR